jgi:molecular chaperone DnaK
LATGKDVQKRIEGASGLKEEDIQRMVKEAEEHEAEDKQKREQVERRNKLDNMCYSIEKTISENKEKLPAAEISNLEGLIKEGRLAVEKQDDDKVAQVLESLEKEAHKLAEVMYKNAGDAAAAGGAPSDGPGDGPSGPAAGGAKKKGGDVIDAEFEETST